MKLSRLWLGLAFFASIGTMAGVAVAQFPNLIIASPVGTELIDVIPVPTGTVPTSPQTVSVALNTIRNTTGYVINAATSGTILTTTAVNNLLLTGAVGTATINFPPSPPDGALFSISNVTGSNFSGTITLATTDTATFIPASPTIVNLAKQTGQEWQYTAASKIWYQVR